MFVISVRRFFIASAMFAVLSCTFGSIASADRFYKDGVIKVELSTDWTRGGGQPTWCASLANDNYPGKPFEIQSSSEEFKWDIPELHIGANYKYHCTLLIDTKG